MKKSLIVGVDGTEGGRAAVDEAIALAIDLHATVTFAYVCKPPSAMLGNPLYQRGISADLAQAHRAIAESVERANGAGIEADSEILEGDPGDELVSLADNRNAHMIVVGSRGHGALAGALLGSVSQSVSQHASRPVVVAKQTQGDARQVA